MSVNVGPWLKKNPNILTSIKNVSSFFCQLHIAINVSFDGATYLKCCMSSSVWPMVKPVQNKNIAQHENSEINFIDPLNVFDELKHSGNNPCKANNSPIYQSK